MSLPIRLEIASRVLVGMLADQKDRLYYSGGEPATTMEENARIAAVIALAYADALISAHNGESQ